MRKFLRSIKTLSGLLSFVLIVNVLNPLTIQSQTYYCGQDAIMANGAEVGTCSSYSHSFGCNNKVKWLGYAQAPNGAKGTATFNNVNVTTAGNYNFTIGYTHFFADGAHIMRITVNGVNVDKSLSSTGDWCAEETFDISIPLNAGSNTIVFQSNGSQQSPDLTYFLVPAQPMGIEENSIEKNVTISTINKQIVIENNFTNASGSVYVYDVLGHVVLEKKIESHSNLYIPSTDLNTDQIYFVQVNLNNQSYTKKIFLFR